MPDRALYKSTVVESLDEFYSGNDEQLREACERARDLFESQPSFEAIVGKLEDEGRRAETFVHPVDDSTLRGDDFEGVIRRAYTHAIDLALAHPSPVPIETLWMSGVSDELEVHVCDGARHVTVLWLIPSVREWGSRRSKFTGWVVTASGDLEQKSGPQGNQTAS